MCQDVVTRWWPGPGTNVRCPPVSSVHLWSRMWSEWHHQDNTINMSTPVPVSGAGAKQTSPESTVLLCREIVPEPEMVSDIPHDSDHRTAPRGNYFRRELHSVLGYCNIVNSPPKQLIGCFSPLKENRENYWSCYPLQQREYQWTQLKETVKHEWV